MLASALLLNGCTTNSSLATTTTASNSSSDAENQLTAEFVYKFLVAEVAGQRGDAATSAMIFYDLAKSTKDPGLAERAAKTAAYGNVPGLVIPAIKLWSELDPTSSEVQQAMTEMLIATNKLDDAKPFLAKLLVKEETRAGSFLYLNNLLNKSTDKAGALRLVQSLAKPYPKLAEAQFAIAQSAWVARQDEVALQALNRAETLRPGWGLAALLKGQVLFEKSPQAAITFYQEFLKNNPGSNEVRLNMAKLLVQQKQYDAAKKEYPIIMQNTKGGANSAEITAVIGLLSFQSNDYSAAENYFQQALTFGFKDQDQIHLYLAQLAEKQKQDDAAIAWYNKVQAGPHYLEAQLNLANIIARTQSVDKAIEQLDAIDDLNTEQQIVVIQTQASLLAKAKRDQDAFDLLNKAVQNLPNTPELVYDYALAAERLQKFEIMEAELRKTIAAKPDFAAAYNALGYSFADRNIKLDEAVTLIEKALTLSPNDHYMLDSLGWAHYRKGNLDKAINYLQQAYNINRDPEIAAHLGEVLWKKGKYDEAKKIWSDALAADPGNEVLLTTTNKFKS
ncbi:MAG: tetratricopeptide repeat protein [Betaproteobacteria bacterium HGW-Betaproteobacteria-20]|nr:MAG: tetratricopeptide repeat protein [Betaproteobacteria bacterium HGW-Betaproteobacteria-20]